MSLSLSINYSSLYFFIMHDYITNSPAQYFVHLNLCIIRNLATSMTFDAPTKHPCMTIFNGKTIIIYNSPITGKFKHNAFNIPT